MYSWSTHVLIMYDIWSKILWVCSSFLGKKGGNEIRFFSEMFLSPLCKCTKWITAIELYQNIIFLCFAPKVRKRDHCCEHLCQKCFIFLFHFITWSALEGILGRLLLSHRVKAGSTVNLYMVKTFCSQVEMGQNGTNYLMLSYMLQLDIYQKNTAEFFNA